MRGAAEGFLGLLAAHSYSAAARSTSGGATARHRTGLGRRPAAAARRRARPQITTPRPRAVCGSLSHADTWSHAAARRARARAPLAAAPAARAAARRQVLMSSAPAPHSHSNTSRPHRRDRTLSLARHSSHVVAGLLAAAAHVARHAHEPAPRGRDVAQGLHAAFGGRTVGRPAGEPAAIDVGARTAHVARPALFSALVVWPGDRLGPRGQGTRRAGRS